jgi:hypothetical protein
MLTDRAFACLLIAALLLAGAAREIVGASRRADASNTRQGFVGCEHASPASGLAGCRVALLMPDGTA